MKLTRESKVVCCCRAGQVRSVAARNILVKHYGLRNVFTCGLDNNTPESLAFIFGWAEVILVVGSLPIWQAIPPSWKYKAVFLEVGQDVWGDYRHEELQCLLKPLMANLF